MKIHEYQAKQILSKYGVPVPRGSVAYSVDEATKVAEDLGTDVCVVKAQIHAGGRGKGGGVKVSKGMDAVSENANSPRNQICKNPPTIIHDPIAIGTCV